MWTNITPNSPSRTTKKINSSKSKQFPRKLQPNSRKSKPKIKKYRKYHKGIVRITPKSDPKNRKQIRSNQPNKE